METQVFVNCDLLSSHVTRHHMLHVVITRDVLGMWDSCHREEKSFPPSGGLLTKSKWMGGKQLKAEEKIRIETKPEMQTKQETPSNN